MAVVRAVIMVYALWLVWCSIVGILAAMALGRWWPRRARPVVASWAESLPEPSGDLSVYQPPAGYTRMTLMVCPKPGSQRSRRRADRRRPSPWEGFQMARPAGRLSRCWWTVRIWALVRTQRRTRHWADPEGAAMISRDAEDALTTLIMQRLAAAGFWKAFVESTAPDDVDAVQAAIDRHGARMHAAGEPGWTVQ